MYDNIGGKIKELAQVSVAIEIIFAVIAGVAMMIEGAEVLTSLVVMFVASIIAWVSSWILYGFGEIIVKLCEIEQNTRNAEIKSEVNANINSTETVNQ